MNGTAFWGHDKNIKQPMSANAWMRSCLKRMQIVLNDKDQSFRFTGKFSDNLWTFSIYSQWMLASFKSHINLKNGEITFYGMEKKREHVAHWRTQPEIQSQIDKFLGKFYSAWGSTDDIHLFIKTLSKLGIFSSERAEKTIEIMNSSKNVQENDPEKFEIKEDLIAEYYAMLPEEFWFHQICSTLAIQHWEHLTSEEESKVVT